MDSDLRAERLSVDVRSFSVAPCVQGQAASMLAIDRCDTLKDAGVRVSLQGPEPEVLDVMRAGFPLKVGEVCKCLCLCVCVFIELHITAQSCNSMPLALIEGGSMIVCV